MNTLDRKKYHSIFLIIENDSTIYYKNLILLWKSYMKLHPDILCIFLRLNPNLIHDYFYDENLQTLYIKGSESYIPGILHKTVKGFEYVEKNFDYDYVTRTNLSSFWYFPNYIERLKTLPTQKLCFGNIGYTLFDKKHISFISGAGMTFTRDVIQNILQHTSDICYDYIDDISLSKLLLDLQYTFIESGRIDLLDEYFQYDKKKMIEGGGFHFRIKVINEKKRNEVDIRHYYEFVRLCYPEINDYIIQKYGNFQFAKFGRNNVWSDVTNILRNHLVNQTFEAPIYLNLALFQHDPLHNVHKYIMIEMNNQESFLFDENSILF